MTDIVLPYHFVPFSQINSAEVNANFDALRDGVNLGVPSVPDGVTTGSLEVYLENRQDWSVKDSHGGYPGALGNGITDDTAAFNRAITACATAGGGRVLVPPSANPYMIDSRMNSGLSINLQSYVELYVCPGATIKQMSGVLSPHEGSALILVDRAQDWAITGYGTIQGDLATRPGLDSTDTWYGTGIFVGTSKRGRIENVRIIDCVQDGIQVGYSFAYVGASGYTNSESQDIVITGVFTNNCRRQGMSVTAAKRVRTSGSCFMNTGPYSTASAWSAPGGGIDFEQDNQVAKVQDCSVINCHFENNAYGLFFAYCKGVRAANCTFRNNDTGALWGNASEDCYLSGSHLEQVGVTSMGMEFNSVGGGAFENTIRGTFTKAIYLHAFGVDGDVGHSRICRNSIYGPATPRAGVGYLAISGGAGNGVFSNDQTGSGIAVGSVLILRGVGYLVTAFNAAASSVTLAGAPNDSTGFKIMGDGSTAASGIHIVNHSTHNEVTDNRVEGCQVGIWLSAASFNRVERNWMRYNTGHGAYTDGSSNMVWRDNVSEENGLAGFAGEYVDCVLNGNRARLNGTDGFTATLTDCQFLNNRADSNSQTTHNTSDNFSLAGTRILFDGNIARMGTGAKKARYGFWNAASFVRWGALNDLEGGGNQADTRDFGTDAKRHGDLGTHGIATRGDISLTLLLGMEETQSWDTMLTVNRDCILPTIGVNTSYPGMRFRIILRPAGAFTLYIRDSSLAIIKALVGGPLWADVMVNRTNTAWVVSAYGSL